MGIIGRVDPRFELYPAPPELLCGPPFPMFVGEIFPPDFIILLYVQQ